MAAYLTLLLSALSGFTAAESATGMVMDTVTEGADIGQQAFSIAEMLVDAIGNDEANGTEVLIQINSAGHKDWDFEGAVGIVWAFDTYNNVLGSSDVRPGGRTAAGSKNKLTVHQYLEEGSDPQYIDIIAADDEVCISFMYAKGFQSIGKPYLWLGDVGKACGQAWEHGQSAIARVDGQGIYKPACVWLDQDHGEDIDKHPTDSFTNTITNRQMKINLHAYVGTAETELFQSGARVDTDYVCGATTFTWDMDDPIEGITARGPYSDLETGRTVSDNERTKARSTSPKQGRVARPQSQKMAERLWVNSRPDQSAIELCNSPTSRGSDFVSTDEGLFCDMDTKTLYPLCKGDQKIGCFDLDTDALQLRKRDHLRKRASVKQYKKITHVD